MISSFYAYPVLWLRERESPADPLNAFALAIVDEPSDSGKVHADAPRLRQMLR